VSQLPPPVPVETPAGPGYPAVPANRFSWLDPLVALVAASGLVFVDAEVVAIAGMVVAAVGIVLNQAPLWYRPSVRIMLISLGIMLPALAYFGWRIATFHPL
jgi:hypothetical protein